MDAQCAVSFRQLLAVGTVDERNMRPVRDIPAKRLIKLGLAAGIDEMVVPANDMGDAHIMIIHDNGEHIGRRPIRAQQHEIVKAFVLPRDVALDMVCDFGLAVRHAKADGEGRVFGLCAVAIGTAEGLVVLAGFGLQRLDFFRCGVAR